MAGDKHVLAFFWFQRFVAFICMLEQIIFSNRKYSIVSMLFLLDMKYVEMLSVPALLSVLIEAWASSCLQEYDTTKAYDF